MNELVQLYMMLLALPKAQVEGKEDIEKVVCSRNWTCTGLNDLNRALDKRVIGNRIGN